MKQAALEYYDRGWMPIPLRWQGDVENRKRPAIDRWRQYQFLRPEREQIEQWWTEMPEANIALLCGRVSGLVVVDFDGQVDDPVAFLERHKLPTDCAVVETGKGFHAYFRHPGGTIENGVRVARLEGVAVDLRGDGGYVVAPPSVHGSGRRYAWSQHPHPGLPVFPASLRQLVDESPDKPAPTTAKEFIREAEELDRALFEGVPEGSRNHRAAQMAGLFLRYTKADEGAAWSLLKFWNQQNKPPLDEHELQGILVRIAARERLRLAEDEVRQAEEAGDIKILDGIAWAAAVRNMPPRHGVPAPSLPGLEEVGGIVPRDMLILAGRPGMGKSTCAWGVAIDMGIQRKLPTIIFSTEMTAHDVARWVAGKMFQVSAKMLTAEQWNDALDHIARSQLTIVDKGSISVEQIEAIVKARPATKLVIVDHVQRLRGITEDRNGSIAAIAAALKNLAKDHDCTVLVLSHMNRSGGAHGGRPGLESLRDSGMLEAEADAVCLLWSDHDDPTADPLPVKFYWAKNRHGALTEVPAYFFKRFHRFTPMDPVKRIEQSSQQENYTRKVNALVEQVSEGERTLQSVLEGLE